MRGPWGWQGPAPAEAARVAARLAIGPDGATAPAVLQADAVRISAEARALLRGGAQTAGDQEPLPAEVIGAMRAVLTALSPAEARAALEQLGALLRRVPGEPPWPAGSGARHGRLMRLANLAMAAIAAGRAGRAAGLVRALTGPLPGEASDGDLLLERAAAALYLAAGRVAREASEGSDSGPGVARMVGREPGELPPALLSLAGAPGRGRRATNQRGRGKPGRTRDGRLAGEQENAGPGEVLDRDARCFV